MDDIVREGRIHGIGFYEIYDFTVADVLEYISIDNERKRNDEKRQAVMMFNTVAMMNELLTSRTGAKVAVYEKFPYWTQEEINEMRIKQMKEYFKTHCK